MKNIMIIIITCLISGSSYAQSSRSITDINNNSISMDSLSGKKLLVIVLPLQKDSATINQLIRFQNRYAQKVKVIGLSAAPSGVTPMENVRTIYQDVSAAGVIVTEGLRTTDTAISVQESVLAWLTSKSTNRQTDRFVTGSKYFLSEDGRMYAQFGKEMSLDDRLVKNIVNTIIPRSALSIPEKPISTTDSTKQVSGHR